MDLPGYDAWKTRSDRDEYPDQPHYCSCCGARVTEYDFEDEISQREFEISGLCQDCQDETFTEEEEE